MSTMSLFRSLLLNCVVYPIIAVILIWLLFRKPVGNMYRRVYAYVVGDKLIDRINRILRREKEELFKPLLTIKGDNLNLTLLEVGAGGGANFKYYPDGTNIICVDPNPNFLSYLQKNVAEFPHVNLKQFIVAKGEDMSSIPDGVCDVVVCTLVLCSVDDIGGMMKEVRRVLKPGGVLFYLEHVAANPDSWFYTFQSLLSPVWSTISDGCTLNKMTWINIDQAGFSEVEYKRFKIKTGGILLRYLMSGTATK